MLPPFNKAAILTVHLVSGHTQPENSYLAMPQCTVWCIVNIVGDGSG